MFFNYFDFFLPCEERSKELYGIFIKVNQTWPRKRVWGITFLELQGALDETAVFLPDVYLHTHAQKQIS